MCHLFAVAAAGCRHAVIAMELSIALSQSGLVAVTLSPIVLLEHQRLNAGMGRYATDII